jgi:hypothetical protein
MVAVTFSKYSQGEFYEELLCIAPKPTIDHHLMESQIRRLGECGRFCIGIAARYEEEQ